MDALDAITRRRSVRKYRPDPVPKEILEKLVDAGRLAPTARAVEPWEFVVVTDPKMRQQVAAITEYGKFIAEAPACIIVFCKDTKYYLEDGCAAVENILIAATALGLGSCWVAGDKKPYAGEVASLLGVPDGYRLIAFLAIGKSDQPESPRKKRPLKEVIHWEKF